MAMSSPHHTSLYKQMLYLIILMSNQQHQSTEGKNKWIWLITKNMRMNKNIYTNEFLRCAARTVPKLDAVSLIFRTAAHSGFSLWPVVCSAVATMASGDRWSALRSQVIPQSAWSILWLIRRCEMTGATSFSDIGSGDSTHCIAAQTQLVVTVVITQKLLQFTDIPNNYPVVYQTV